MTPGQIKQMLGKSLPLPDEHPCWGAFCREMRDKDYGREPLIQAWHFFKRGWAACANVHFV